jgi:hypothetical protein
MLRAGGAVGVYHWAGAAFCFHCLLILYPAWVCWFRSSAILTWKIKECVFIIRVFRPNWCFNCCDFVACAKLLLLYISYLVSSSLFCCRGLAAIDAEPSSWCVKRRGKMISLQSFLCFSLSSYFIVIIECTFGSEWQCYNFSIVILRHFYNHNFSS